MRAAAICKKSLLQWLIAGLAMCFTLLGLATNFYAAHSTLPKFSPSDYIIGLPETHRGLSKQRRFAIVHLIDAFHPTYGSALLGGAYRLVKLHSNISKNILSGTLDLVVMVPEGTNTTGYEHPYIRYVYFNGSHAINTALRGKFGRWEIATHLKLCAMNLDEYDKVVFVDLDMLILSQLVSILVDATPPAMVQWGEYPKLDFNSGFHIFRPSQEMFRDAVDALQNLGPATLILEELRNMSSRDSIQRKIPRDPTRWGGYRSDQEFLFAFYDILPPSRSKWGPIHPLPYRYNAREESLIATTDLFLAQKAGGIPETAQYNGAHLHLFGGFGHDGRGHRILPIPEEDGTFGLVAVHMTRRKPWKEWYIKGFDETLVENLTLIPSERCPQYIYQVEFWDNVLQGIAEAMVDQRYGYRWTGDSHFSFLQERQMVKQCFSAELQALLSLKDTLTSNLTRACPDITDCTNKHCRWRSVEQSCNQTLPKHFQSLIDNR